MALGGTAPPRGSAAAAASLRRRREGEQRAVEQPEPCFNSTLMMPGAQNLSKCGSCNEHWLHCICCRP
ncbi:uncharacterized protein DS421_12g378270 [Arachis hypogaea]|uniref:Uncharacterized protein n=1 Tax=Arachis hypogaea TaxID=3818 RepID=A0A445EA28_ARAHY|nr:uncharacterized protein DS421_12g378270 [Arachis hypogaea]RYR72183.1 hypothetical protein Ahy_A02g006393 [Arachis hypogaea]